MDNEVNKFVATETATPANAPIPGVVGQKTLRLRKLMERGYRVPEFIEISRETLLAHFPVSLKPTAGAATGLAEHVRIALPAERYAVRSSALAEDSDTSSHAGEFLTELDVAPERLSSAIAIVCSDAKERLGTLDKFSILIQRYIKANHAGVAFTRDPLGGREVVVEWVRGAGLSTVAGKKSNRWTLLRDRYKKDSAPFARGNELITTMLEIEKLFEHPQDIEWAIDDSGVYILQTRPITTMMPKTNRALKAIEFVLAEKKEYYYQRTGIAETVFCPSNLAFDIIRSLYTKGGPIDRVYTRYGIEREAREQLQLFSGYLYVDKEEEIKEFFPTHSYLRKKNGRAGLVTFSGIGRTIKNFFALSRLPDTLKHGEELAGDLYARMAALEGVPIENQETAYRDLVDGYETIFAINLLCLSSWKKLTSTLSKRAPAPATLFAAALPEVSVPELTIPLPESGLVGNSIDIGDEGPFVAEQTSAARKFGKLAWWESLPDRERRALAPLIARAHYFDMLRERGRWLTVLLMNRLRNALIVSAQVNGIEDHEIIYDAPLSEALKGEWDIAALSARRVGRESTPANTLPQTLASFIVPQGAGSYSVSPGKVEGVIVNAEVLLFATRHGGKQILITDSLRPSLARHLPSLAGIISEEGGMLAHLAIMAREKGIPVMVVPGARSKFPVASRIILDADGETVTKLNQ